MAKNKSTRRSKKTNLNKARSGKHPPSTVASALDGKNTVAKTSLAGPPSSSAAHGEKNGAKLQAVSKTIASPGVRTTAATVPQVPGGAQGLKSEFEQVSEKLQPLLEKRTGPPTLSKEEIGFLVQQTSVDVRKIDWFSQSQSLAGGNKHLAAFYYAILSQNLPADPAALLSRSRDSVVRALRIATATRKIPTLKPEEISEIFDKELPKLRTENFLKPAVAGQKATLGDLLRTIPKVLDDKCLRAVADVIAQNGINFDKLPAQLKDAGLAQSQAIEVERTLRLSDLTMRNVPLMAHLQDNMVKSQDASLKPLTAIGRDQWIDLAHLCGTPPGSDLTPEAYAIKVEVTLDSLHPTEMLAARLANGDLVINGPGFEKLAAFFKANPSFDILNSSVETLMRHASPANGGDKERLVSALLRLQRVKKLSTTWDEAGVLLNTGFWSALDVVHFGRDRLAKCLAGQVRSDRVNVIYRSAQAMHNMGLVLMSRMLPRFSPTPVPAMESATRVKDLSVAKDSPTLQQLFGSLDYCACDPDQSVLSPAAYFVDLLHFLDPNQDGKSVLRSLLEGPEVAPGGIMPRRPDLVDLQLSKENTETELPYIDLVLEILENAVALPVKLALPPGTNGEAVFEAALAAEEAGKVPVLSDAMREQLQKTSLDTIGPDLKVSKEKSRLGELTPSDGSDPWIISDEQRRWTLHNQVGGFKANIPLKELQTLEVPKSAFAKLLKQLNRGVLPDPLKAEIEALLNSNAKWRHTQICSYTITEIGADSSRADGRVQTATRWRIICEVGIDVTVKKNRNGGVVGWKAAAGQDAKKTYSARAYEATVAGLNRGEVTGLLSAFFPGDSYKIKPGTTADSWAIRTEPVEVLLIYQSDELNIAALTYQTVGDSEDLKACPQNQNPIAYEILRSPSANFPWSLPFNLPLESVRACLDRIGVTRRKLIELTKPETFLKDAGWAREVLAISKEESDLITENDAASEKLWSNWGSELDEAGNATVFDASADNGCEAVVSGKPLDVLSRVSIILQQARVSYDDLRKLLSTKFVGGSALIVTPPNERCPCKMKICGLKADHLDRLHRFIRLWRRIGWQIDELDMSLDAFRPIVLEIVGTGKPAPAKKFGPRSGAVAAGVAGLTGGKTIPVAVQKPGPPDITPDVLLSLAHLKRLQELLDLPIKLLTTWWGDGRELLYRSFTFPGQPQAKLLYEQLFIGAAAQGRPDPDFALNGDQTDLCLAARSKKLSEKVPALSAALGIRRADFNALLPQLLKLFGIEDKLTLGNLFTLWRTVGLIRALGLTSTDFASALSFFPSPPFDSTMAMNQFCDAVKFIQDSGFSLEELTYLLQDVAPPGLPICLSDVQVARMLNNLRSSIQAKLTSIERDALDDRTLPALLLDADLRSQLSDVALSQLATFLGVDFTVMRHLVVSDQTGAGIAMLKHPSDSAKDGIDVFLSADFLAKDAKDAKDSPNAEKTIRVLQKASIILSRLNVKSTEVAWIANPNRKMAALNFNDLPPVKKSSVATDLFTSWRQMVTLYGMRDAFEGMPALLGCYVAALGAASGDDAMSGARTVLGQGFSLVNAGQGSSQKPALPGQDPVQPIATSLGINAVADYCDPIKLKQLLDLVPALKKLGADSEGATLLIGDWPIPAINSSAPDLGAKASTLARALLRAKYGASAWRGIFKPISDNLRIRQRDALVDYLVSELSTKSLQVRNANDLYEYFLIDPRMAPCMLTSRLVQATAAVQLFIQRCLMNLESTVSPDVFDKDRRERWQWMKNYRIWQANREVFLFPENWLFPELRDDKSDTFKNLESRIAQAEPTYQLTRDSLLLYFDELADIAKIKVFGLYEDVAADSSEHVVYIVGRTPDRPYQYYWSSCACYGEPHMHWMCWQTIDVDIDDDHIMPFVLDGNLYIAWPTITQVQATVLPYKNAPTNAWQIALNWARHGTTGWAHKKVTHRTLPVAGAAPALCWSDDARSDITFRVTPQADCVRIAAWSRTLNTSTGQPMPSLASLSQKQPPCGLQVIGQELSYSEKFDDGTESPACGGYRALQYLLDSWSPAGFQLKLFYCYEFPSGEVVGVEPATGLTVEIAVFYQTDLSATDYFVFTPEGTRMAEEEPGTYTYTLDWRSFEPRTNQDARWLRRVDMIIKLSTGDDVISYIPESVGFVPGMNMSDYVSAQNTPCYYRGHLIRVTVQTSWNAVGTYQLAACGDVTTELPNGENSEKQLWDGLPTSDWFGSPCANGYSTSSQLTMQAAQSVEWQGWLRQNSYRFEELFHFDREPPYDKEYQQIIGAPPHGVHNAAVNLDIYDRLTSTASLRRKAYVKFDGQGGLFSLESQQALEGKAFSYNDVDWSGTKWSWLRGIKSTNFDLRFPSELYKWEIYYHAPMRIAEWLTKQQHFEDAQRWLHYIFDPSQSDIDAGIGPGSAASYWHFVPFRQQEAFGDILTLLFELLAVGQSVAYLAEDLGKSVLKGSWIFSDDIESWQKNPFNPFAIARMQARQTAYQWRTLFAYLDNLISWGDQMFRRFTRESVNEAILLYVLTAKLLGPRPQQIRQQRHVPVQSYRDLLGKWDEFGNAWNWFIDSSLAQICQQLSSILQARTDNSEQAMTAALTSVGMLYFCVPSNDKLVGYWDTVEDRLLKIRTCKDIDGAARALSLFAPPIDPELLIRATAAGVDIDTVLADMEAPLLPYRFSALLQKSNEICSEVKALGAGLLGALEKKDAEGLTLLRSSHEIELLKLVTQIKQRQVDDANKSVDALTQNMAVVRERFVQYQKLLGRTVLSFDPDGLPTLETRSALQVAASAPGEESGLGLIQNEVGQLQTMDSARAAQERAGEWSWVASVLRILPENSMSVQIPSVPLPVTVGTSFGGANLGDAAGAVAAYNTLEATRATHEANTMGMFAQYQRREDEWVFQSKLALEEMKQINKQLKGAQIRVDIAQRELDNHLKQIEHAQTVDEFMHGKYTNRELYSWMVGEIAGVYFNCYQLAYDIAKRAERAFQNELGLDNANFIHFGYWNSLKKGLLAGKNLSLDLKRMEMAYLEQNQRELEITKHVSLRQLDPVALLNLKVTGSCVVSLPEWLFDLDFPGHYFRRIKSVGLTIPCVAGPYTSVNCTLTLNKSSYRRKSQIGTNGYPRKTNGDDDRFVDATFVDATFGLSQSIATSSAQNDSGLFELNFRDERYLPFEGAGAISSWTVTLPDEFRQFDYDTISDVILHVRYTARDGVDRSKVIPTLSELFKDVENSNLAILLSLRHEFPSEWAAYVNKPSSGFRATIGKDYFPYFAQNTGRRITINEIDLAGQDGLPPEPLGGLDLTNLSTQLNTGPNNSFVLQIPGDQLDGGHAGAVDPTAEQYLIVRYTLSS